MKAESVSKIKYLKIWDILRQETDEQHPMSTHDLIARLEACGISCDRRTLYRNIEELNVNGYEILVKKGKSNGYYVEDRSFDIPEIQILMDAVQAASFITDKKTPVLIDKIAQLAGSQRAEVLKSNIVQFGTVKGSNESIYYSVNEISQAIIEKRKIGFYYFDYDLHHKRKYRMRTSKPDEQRWYIVNPVATVFHDDKYYLFCYNDYHGNIGKDKPREIKCMDEDEIPKFYNALMQVDNIQWRVAVLTTLMTGMRRGEVCGLNWEDVDLDKGRISIKRSYSESPRHGVVLKEPKTKNSKRTISISNILIKALSEYKEWYNEQRELWGDRWVESGSVFIQKDGKRVHPANIKMWVSKTCKLAGIDHFSVHSLRHTNITLQLMAGVPIVTVSGRAGHSRTSTTTDTYAYYIQSSDKSAAQTINSIFSTAGVN